MQILEKPLQLADIPACRIGDVRGGIALLLQLDDPALGLVLPIEETLMHLVGLSILTGCGLGRGKLNRGVFGVGAGESSLPRDVTLERVPPSIFVDHLLFGDVRQEGDQ